MGYRLKLVVSSPVPADTRAAILTAALARWPFCRGPRDPAAFSGHAVFAPPELTSYLFDDSVAEGRAMAQADEVEGGLQEFSRAFPDVVFAFVEADCFGGNCEYYGFCCRAGQQFLARDRDTGGSLVRLFGGVGIEITGPFEPFARGFFAGPGSGRLPSGHCAEAEPGAAADGGPKAGPPLLSWVVRRRRARGWKG